jgi:WD40 repeat protein
MKLGQCEMMFKYHKRLILILFLLFLLPGCARAKSTNNPAMATALPIRTQFTVPTSTITLSSTPTLIPTSTQTPISTQTATTLIAPPPTQMLTSTTASVKPLYKLINLGTDQGPVYDQSWSFDARLFAAADYDQIKVWDINAGWEVSMLKGHTDFVAGLAWSPKANVLASASQDGTVRLWDGTSLTVMAILDIGQPLGCLTWSPDGRQLAVGSYSGDIYLLNVITQEVYNTWSPDTVDTSRDDIISITWSPDGQTIASGDLEGNIYLWEVATGQARLALTEQDPLENGHDVNGLSWSPDGTMLASAHPDGQIQLWDSATGRMLRAITAHTPPVADVTWSPNGELLASIGYEDRFVRLWDPDTGRLYAEARHDSLPGWSISWSPDGNKIASGCGEWQQPRIGEIIVWIIS